MWHITANYAIVAKEVRTQFELTYLSLGNMYCREVELESWNRKIGGNLNIAD